MSWSNYSFGLFSSNQIKFIFLIFIIYESTTVPDIGLCNLSFSFIKIFVFTFLFTSIKIIWCFRGGYGGSEVAHYLNEMYESDRIKLSSGKILVGFSDITALHIFFNQKLNFA
jgi:muramoyltetrapeptide carboxypeptidase